MSSSAEPRLRGRFITLEGGEGAGKSTQVQHLVDRFARLGLPVLATREPGGTPLAEAYRGALLGGAIAPFGPAAEALVFSAARIDHIDRRIAPALADGTSVICDRFLDSTRAYQGTLGHLDPALIDGLERMAVGAMRPDLTLILDLPPETGLARAAARRPAGQGADRFERQDHAFHTSLRRAFLDIAAREPGRCAVIDASATSDAVSAAIWSVVVERLFPHLEGPPLPDMAEPDKHDAHE